MSTPRPNVTVVGAGLMGSAIAQVFAAAGSRVSLFEPSSSVRAGVPATIAEICRQIDVPAKIVDRISLHDDLGAALTDADLVIEAGPEQLEVKQEIFVELGTLAPGNSLLATNTSAIPIHMIAEPLPASDRHRMLGAHFWNPPHLVSLVEVVQSDETKDESVMLLMGMLADVGMKPVHVKADIPGFIGNRLQHALKREAIALVAEGSCSAEDLDTVVRHGFGARLSSLGPLEQSDLVGLNLTLDIHEVLMPDLDRRPEPHPFLVEKVRAGEIGAKAGQGFLDWPEGRADEVRRRVTKGLVEHRRREITASGTGGG